MRVLVVGSGGREHALAWKISQSKHLCYQFVAPGNAGTAGLPLTVNVPIEVSSTNQLVRFAKDQRVDLVVVGPELPLRLGLVDRLRAEKIRVFGPIKAVARLEYSKAYAKHRMKGWHVPTAPFRVGHSLMSCLRHVERMKNPAVIKKDGLAAGKGVEVSMGATEARRYLRKLFHNRKRERQKLVIEDRLYGDEFSAHAITGNGYIEPFPFVRDYKTVAPHDFTMTGGMGAYGPAAVPQGFSKQVYFKTILPAVCGFGDEYKPVTGCIYPGLMLQSRDPLKFSVLEYNMRFGDPEAQVYMRLLATDILPVLFRCADGDSLELARQFRLKWHVTFAVCVVLASVAYPFREGKGQKISGLEKAAMIPGVVVFHGGTTCNSGELVTNGGRILSVTAVGETLAEARRRAYLAASYIRFDGERPTMRTDIADV